MNRSHRTNELDQFSTNEPSPTKVTSTSSLPAGAIALAISQFISPALQAVQFIVLATLLAPSEFGKWVFPVFALGLMLMVCEVAIPSTIVAHGGKARGLTFRWGLPVMAIAPIAALCWLPQSRDESLLTLALTPVAGLLVSTGIQRGRLTHAKRFGDLARAELLGAVVSVASAVAAAYIGMGVWSFVIAAWTRQSTIVFAQRRLLKGQISVPDGSVGASANIAFYSLLYFAANIDYLLASSLLPDDERGLYFVAFNIATLILYRLVTIVNRVSLPYLAESSEGGWANQARRTILVGSWVALTLTSIVALATSVIPVRLLGEWAGLPEVLALLALGAAGVAIGNLTSTLLVSRRIQWRLSGIASLEITLTTGSLLLLRPTTAREFAQVMTVAMTARGIIWLLAAPPSRERKLLAPHPAVMAAGLALACISILIFPLALVATVIAILGLGVLCWTANSHRSAVT